MSVRISGRLAALPRYEPGLSTTEVLAEYGLDRAVKLASNESPFPPLPEVEAVLRAGLDGLNRYPDGSGRALRAALAERHGVDPARVALGNGSGELMYLLGQAVLDPGRTVVHAEPSFALYPLLAPLSGAEAVAVPLAPDDGLDLDAMAAALDERTGLVLVCNPNNPTGVHRPADEVERFLDGLPEDLAVVVDEAYFDFVDRADAGRVMSMARERPNVLVTRTFSKAHGLCGLRVGYGVGGSDLVEALDRVRPPFNVNALAQAAALESLRHPAALAERIAILLAERARLSAALEAQGVAFTPSHANFILLDAESGAEPGPGVHQRLLARGVIVRDGASLGCPGRLRVTVGAPDENSAFLAALADARRSAPPQSIPTPSLRTTP